MINILTLRGKARQVFRSWDFIVSKLGNMTLGQLQEEVKA